MTEIDTAAPLRPSRVGRIAMGMAAAVTCALGISVLPAAQASAASLTEADFGVADGYQTWTVPAGVHTVTMNVIGGAGGDGATVDSTCSSDSSGAAGWVVGGVPVTPGQTLTVWVGSGGHLSGGGGAGTPDAAFAGGDGGAAGNGLTVTGGGGNGGGGGSASVVWVGSPNDDANIVMVGGGGGGGGGEGAAVYECGGRGGWGGNPATDGHQADGDAYAAGLGGHADNVDPGHHKGWTGSTPPDMFQGVPEFGGGGGGGGAGFCTCNLGSGGGGGAVQDDGSGLGGGGGAGGTSFAAPSATNTFFSSSGAHGSAGSVVFTWGAPTVTSMASGAATVGDQVPLHAFVDQADGGGTVDFANNGKPITGCTNLPFTSGGDTTWEATCTGALSAGVNDVTATYSGDDSSAGSAAEAFWTVRQPTTTSVSVTPSGSVTPGAPIKVDALIGSAYGGGSVQFTDDDATIAGCSAATVHKSFDDGLYHATCSTTAPLSSGPHTLLAAFSGDSIDYGSTGSTHLSVAASQSLPGAPSIGAIIPGDGSATINFSGPTSDGNSPITGYVATATPAGGGTPVTGSGTTDPFTLTGLTNRTTYTVSVAAVNGVGTGPSSTASDPFVPVAPLTITTPSQLPTFPAGKPLSMVLNASGGTGSFVWSLLPGNSLPAGLRLGTDGTIFGTPTTAVTNQQFSVKVADVSTRGQASTKLMSMSINQAAAPDLRVALTHAGTFVTGKSGRYNAQIVNIGTAATRGAIAVTIALPSGLVPTTASGTGWTCHASGRTETCTRTSKINASGSSMVNLTVQVAAAAGKQLSATAKVTPTDATPSNNTSTDKVSVVRR